MKKSNPNALKFYPELWLLLALFLLLFLFFGMWLPFVLIGAWLISQNGPGYGLFSLVFLVFFVPPTFILFRGTWRRWLDCLRYVRAFSHHESDERVVGAKVMLFTRNPRYFMQLYFISIQSPDSLAGQRRWVRAGSPRTRFTSFDPVNDLEGDLVLRNGEPYLFETAKYRIWLVPLDERDPSSKIGQMLDKVADKAIELRAKNRF